MTKIRFFCVGPTDIKFGVLLFCRARFSMPTYAQEDFVGNGKLFFNLLLVTKKRILWEKCKIVRYFEKNLGPTPALLDL